MWPPHCVSFLPAFFVCLGVGFFVCLFVVGCWCLLCFFVCFLVFDFCFCLFLFCFVLGFFVLFCFGFGFFLHVLLRFCYMEQIVVSSECDRPLLKSPSESSSNFLWTVLTRDSPPLTNPSMGAILPISNVCTRQWGSRLHTRTHTRRSVGT